MSLVLVLQREGGNCEWHVVHGDVALGVRPRVKADGVEGQLQLRATSDQHGAEAFDVFLVPCKRGRYAFTIPNSEVNYVDVAKVVLVTFSVSHLHDNCSKKIGGLRTN